MSGHRAGFGLVVAAWVVGLGAWGCGGNGGSSPSSTISGGGSGNRGGSAGNAGTLGLILGGGGGASGGGGSGGSAGNGNAAGTGTAAGGAGACPADQVDCNGTCVGVGVSGGGCAVLSAPPTNVQLGLGIALDADYVYWLETGVSCAVARAPKAGGARQELTTCGAYPGDLAVNATSIIWSESGTPMSVHSAPKAGGTAVTLLNTGSLLAHPIVANDSRIYFSLVDFVHDADVESIDLTGMNPIKHGTNVGAVGKSIVLSENAVYWASGGTEIRTAALTGTQQTTLGMVPGITVMTLMGGDLYANELVPGAAIAIDRVTIPGGQVTHSSLGRQESSYFVASGTTLYQGGPSILYSLPTGTEQPQPVLTTASKLTAIAADASGVYLALSPLSPDRDVVQGGVIVKLQQ